MRTHMCGELRSGDAGKKTVLCGWLHSWRNHGGVLFLDLRDRSGIAQIVARPENAEAFKTAESLRSEFVLRITGTVQPRPGGTVNLNLPTGEVEVVAESIEILNPSKVLPMEVTEHASVNEETRLKYRFLDLRRPKMLSNMITRHRVADTVRKYLDSEGFIEVETPILTRSTPEGARDFLVPSRFQQGMFYALPQSPQMFKQILMVSGIDRYYQLARAFRDEDLRADRQLEHTQIDLEMSFVTEPEIFLTVERMLKAVFKAVGEEIETPFESLEYEDAMLKYGSDKPDLRFGMEIADCSEIFKNTGFKVFSGILSSGGAVRALKAEGGSCFARTEMDRITEFAKANGAKGLVWLKFSEKGVESPVAKYLSEAETSSLKTLLGVKPGDAVFIGADKAETVALFMGALRKELICRLALKPSKKWAFAWIKHFPLLEWKPEENRYDATHNPFTAPLEEDVEKLDTDPGHIRSHQYDVVLNGVELGSGSIRNHRRGIQEKTLALMKYSQEESQKRFGMLLDALDYGAPPHGGIAIGLDRLVAVICGEDSIREVIAFPKTTKGTCPLSNAPNTVEQKQLQELHLKIIESAKKQSDEL